MAATGAAKVGGTHIYFIDLFLSQKKKKKTRKKKDINIKWLYSYNTGDGMGRRELEKKDNHLIYDGQWQHSVSNTLKLFFYFTFFFFFTFD